MTGTRRQAAVMLFVNPKGELLLQLRDDKPSIPHPARWSVVGGGVEPGETATDALLREVAEEVEQTPESFEFWQTYRGSASDVAIFAARLDEPAQALPLHEGQRVEFVTPQAAMMLPLVPWLAEVLPAFARSDLYARLCGRAAPPQPANAEAASVIFVNQRGELLLRLRSDSAAIPFPRCWDLIGGAVEEGESHAEAVVRETLEELCLRLTGHVYWQAIRGIVLIHVYAARLDVPAEALTLLEGDRVAWLSPGDALELPLVPYMQRLIPEFTASAVYARLKG